MSYSFGVSGPVIWGMHIIVGGVLFYMGYELNQKRPLPEFLNILLMVVGAMVATYHTHLAYLHYNK